MKRSYSLFLVAIAAVGMSGCARGLAESYTSMGFRNQKVVFITDQADVAVRTTAPSLEKTPYFQDKEDASTILRKVTRDSLVAWGSDCDAHFFPKEGSYSLRIGLMHAADGWNVADPSVVAPTAQIIWCWSIASKSCAPKSAAPADTPCWVRTSLWTSP